MERTETAPADTRIEQRGNRKRVLILGAGLSGLVAGYELLRAGHEITILEAQMRPGGRVLTLRDPFSDGLIAEAGAGRVPANHDWTHRYIRDFDLVTVPLIPESLTPLLYVRGKRVRLTPATRLAEHLDLSAAEQGLDLSGLV